MINRYAALVVLALLGGAVVLSGCGTTAGATAPPTSPPSQSLEDRLQDRLAENIAAFVESVPGLKASIQVNQKRLDTDRQVNQIESDTEALWTITVVTRTGHTTVFKARGVILRKEGYLVWLSPEGLVNRIRVGKESDMYMKQEEGPVVR